MSDNITIPSNVWEFIDLASKDVGRMAADKFGQEMHSQIVEGKCVASPIEQIFLVALHVMARANFVEVDPEPYELRGEMCGGFGMHVVAQHPVDQYRADFLVTFTGFGPDARTTTVLVELDGHEFHDKDKRQRSYEKARARHLARRGYTVLHYTGSDVVKDPYRVAHEVMDTLECFGGMGCQPYDPANPLGID